MIVMTYPPGVNVSRNSAEKRSGSFFWKQYGIQAFLDRPR